MTTALIFAGGTGRRMNTQAKPKQFLELHGKPIILYTLEHFEKHPGVDAILIVCIQGWISELERLLRINEYTKVIGIVPGGDGGDKSIYCGLKALEDKCSDDDIVLIHDGVRPFVNAELISSSIAKTKECGAAITVEASKESVVRLNRDRVADVPLRSEMFTAKAPQSFRFGLIWDLYKRAQADGIRTIDSAHLCSIYGVEMHAIESTPNNIKVTTPADYYIFRALYEAVENQQILGFS